MGACGCGLAPFSRRFDAQPQVGNVACVGRKGGTAARHQPVTAPRAVQTGKLGLVWHPCTGLDPARPTWRALQDSGTMCDCARLRTSVGLRAGDGSSSPCHGRPASLRRWCHQLETLRCHSVPRVAGDPAGVQGSVFGALWRFQRLRLCSNGAMDACAGHITEHAGCTCMHAGAPHSGAAS